MEVKSVESLQPIHQAQMLTYMKMGGWKVGLPINFNVSILKKGIKRLVLRVRIHGNTPETVASEVDLLL